MGLVPVIETRSKNTFSAIFSYSLPSNLDLMVCSTSFKFSKLSCPMIVVTGTVRPAIFLLKMVSDILLDVSIISVNISINFSLSFCWGAVHGWKTFGAEVRSGMGASSKGYLLVSVLFVYSKTRDGYPLGVDGSGISRLTLSTDSSSRVE